MRRPRVRPAVAAAISSSVSIIDAIRGEHSGRLLLSPRNQPRAGRTTRPAAPCGRARFGLGTRPPCSGKVGEVALARSSNRAQAPPLQTRCQASNSPRRVVHAAQRMPRDAHARTISRSCSSKSSSSSENTFTHDTKSNTCSTAWLILNIQPLPCLPRTCTSKRPGDAQPCKRNGGDPPYERTPFDRLRN